MKKSIYLFCTKLWIYVTELPALAIFTLAAIYNKHSEEPMGLYPLMIVSLAAAVIIFLYFLRFISINTDEIRYHGMFSSRDRDFIKADRTLIITLKPFGNMKLELYGDAGEIPPFDWMKPEDVQYRDVCYFSGIAVGGRRDVKRIAKYFTVPESELDAICNAGYEFSNDTVTVKTEDKNECTVVSIHFNKTII